MAALRGYLPGLAFLVAVGSLAQFLGTLTPVHSLLAAILLGALVANTVGVPEIFRPGAGTYNLWLEVGIVLMGVRISLGSVLGAGPALVLAVVGAVALSLAVVELLARGVFGLSGRLGSLLAAGASVCGVSAVVAVAGAIRADENQVAYATSTILAFDALTLFTYPALGHLLGLPDRIFGIWAGLTMFSTGPVTAAGFAHSDLAGEWATLTKLTRNALLGGLVVGYSLLYAETKSSSGGWKTSVRDLWNGFPKFVLGFVSLVLLASTGVLGDAEIARLTLASDWAFLVAFAGLGTSIEVRALRGTGVRPLALVGVALLVVSAVALAVVRIAF
ncbi:YeiH family protein [Halorussus amylolyticus]|uniref:YeiH family protein n=1 Tax=Halorussus amylolyticus TaxID=1126242 RepID=UPI00104997B2|nr:putative sulfate exporter family transporter [Halorussus amylolyticus]